MLMSLFDQVDCKNDNLKFIGVILESNTARNEQKKAINNSRMEE